MSVQYQPESVARTSICRRLFELGAASWVKNSVGFGSVTTVIHFALISSSALAAARCPSSKVPQFTFLLLFLTRFWLETVGILSSAVLQPVSFRCYVPCYRHVDRFPYYFGHYLIGPSKHSLRHSLRPVEFPSAKSLTIRARSERRGPLALIVSSPLVLVYVKLVPDVMKCIVKTSSSMANEPFNIHGPKQSNGLGWCCWHDVNSLVPRERAFSASRLVVAGSSLIRMLRAPRGKMTTLW